MKLPQRSIYALSALLDISLHPTGDLVKIAGIAQRQNIPVKFLEGILCDLKQRGFILSRRGGKGGYRLARSAGQITVGQVLTAFGDRPKRKHHHHLSDLFARLDRSVWAILDSTTFADLSKYNQCLKSNLAATERSDSLTVSYPSLDVESTDPAL